MNGMHETNSALLCGKAASGSRLRTQQQRSRRVPTSTRKVEFNNHKPLRQSATTQEHRIVKTAGAAHRHKNAMIQLKSTNSRTHRQHKRTQHPVNLELKSTRHLTNATTSRHSKRTACNKTAPTWRAPFYTPSIPAGECTPMTWMHTYLSVHQFDRDVRRARQSRRYVVQLHSDTTVPRLVNGELYCTFY